MHLYHIEVNGLSGFINEIGEVVIPPIFDGLLSTYFSDALCPFEADGKCGYIDMSGKVAIKPRYTSVQDFSEGLGAVCNEAGEWGYVDQSGAEVIPCKYNDACGFSSDGLATVQVGAAWGYIDKAGNMVISPVFDEAFDFDGVLAKVEYRGGEAYVNRSGDIVWPSSDD